MKNEKILLQHSKVFNSNGTVKNCGRAECICLMEMLAKEQPNIDFGNTQTGFMNIKNIQNYLETK